MEQLAIREEIRENIKSGQLSAEIDIIVIDNTWLTSSNIWFKRTGDEFTYLGKKYDILKKESGSTTTTFYAINDSKEEHLFASLEDHLQTTTDLSKPNKNHPFAKNFKKNILKIVFFERSNTKSFLNSSEIKFTSTDVIYNSTDPKGIFLPPEIA
jgi:hypothetical protein